MALITDKLRAVMALDPDRIEIDFAGRDYRWSDIARVVASVASFVQGKAEK